MIKVKFFLVCFFALFVSCAYCQNYSYAINVGLSKKNAKMTDGFSFETCSYYSYNRKLKKYLFDQQYSTKTNFIFTSNPRLIYEFNLESGQLKILARSVQPVDKVVSGGALAGLSVYVNESDVLPSVASVLERAKSGINSKAVGPVRLILMHPSLPGDVEMLLNGKFPVTPETKGALKSLGGVVEVKDF